MPRLRSIRDTLKMLVPICLLLTIMIASELVITGASPGNFLHTYQAAAATKLSPFSGNTIDRILKSWSLAVSVLLLVTYARRPPALCRRTAVTVIGTYALIQLCLNVSNTQPETIFLAPACAVVLLSSRASRTPFETEEQASRQHWLSKLPTTALPAMMCLLVLIPQIISSAFGLALSAAVASGEETAIVISAGKGISLPVHGAAGDAGRADEFAVNVNRGVRALRRLSVTNETIAALDYVNPFPALLGLPSPKGVPLVWALGNDQPYDIVLRPRELFGNACIVMLPLRPTQVVKGSTELVIAAAKPILTASFDLIGKDDYWKIYRRRDGCG